MKIVLALALTLFGAVIILVSLRLIVPALINSHTDSGLLLAGATALLTIGAVAAVVMKALELLNEETHDEE